MSASVDELTCRFVDVSGRKHVIHANIAETYPASPPVWFSESEDGKVAEAVACLAGTAGLDNHMLYQVKTLVRNLCSQFALPGEKHGLDLNTCLVPSVLRSCLLLVQIILVLFVFSSK